jgi:hypothetical protein
MASSSHGPCGRKPLIRHLLRPAAPGDLIMPAGAVDVIVAIVT